MSAIGGKAISQGLVAIPANDPADIRLAKGQLPWSSLRRSSDMKTLFGSEIYLSNGGHSWNP